MRFIRILIITLLILGIHPVMGLFEIGTVEPVKYHQFVITGVTPIDFYPSEIKTINITLQNIYNYSGYGVSTMIDPEKADPIKFTGELQKYVGNEIGAKKNFTIQYEVYIKDNIPKGTYYLPLNVLWSVMEDGTAQRQEPLFIGIVVAENPEVIKIDTVNITTIPEHVKSGDRFKLKIVLRNVGNSRLNQIRVGLDVKIPFSSVGSSTEKFINEMQPYQTEEVLFDLATDKQTPSRLYNFNLTLDYKGNSNRLQSQSGSFGIDVEDFSELYIQDVNLNPTTLTPKGEGLLMVQVANAGSNEVKNVRVSVFGGDKILTQSQNFIGVIKPGPKESETTSFGVFIDKDIDIGEHGLNIQINYDDVNGNHHTKSKLFIVKVSDIGSIISIDDSKINDLMYVFIFTAFSYGIFLIVGFQIDRKK